MSTAILKPKLPFLKHPVLRQSMAYAAIWIVLFVLLSFADRLMKGTSPQLHLLTLMLVIVLLGVLNWWLLSKKVLIGEPEWVKFLVILVTILTGIFIFFMFSKGTEDFIYYYHLYLPAMSLFALPWSFMLAFRAHTEIPAWKYLPVKVDGLGEWLGKISFAEDQNRGIRWAFGEDFTDFDESGTYNFRTLSPHEVMKYTMEDLFNGLLAFHNYNINPQQAIEFKNSEWQFYHYSPWYFPKGRKMMNPKKTLRQNGLKFKQLSASQRENMQNIRTDLSKNFKYTTIYIQRIRPTN